MQLKPFELERYFAKYEFTTKYLLSCSDCESLALSELLAMASEESLALWNNLQLSYTESPGHPLLREEIAKLYSSISSANVNVMIPEEAIFVAMNCLLVPGDEVITISPGYQSLYEIANALNCRIKKWIPDFSKGTWNFDLEKLKSAISEKTKLLVVNFPHNPTGASVSTEEFSEIIELCRKNKVILFSDEMYRFLEYEKNRRLPSASDLYENAFSLFGMSKSFALPGLRIGWLTSKNNKGMQKIAEFKDYTSICNNAPGEILSIIALQNKTAILKRNLKIISENLAILDAFFAKHQHLFQWKRPEAGPIAFPEFKSTVPIADFCMKLLEKKNIMLLPASVYNFPGNFFRIGFARKNLKSGLEGLDHFLKMEF